MPSISSLGVGSGLDLNGLLDQLRSAERQKLTPITEQRTEEQAKISAYGRLQSGLEKLQGAVDTLNDASTYTNLSANVQGEGMTASVGEEANAGRYEITVKETARAGSLASQGVSDPSAALVGAGGDTLTLTFDGRSDSTVTLAEGDSLEDIRDAINADDAAGVDASIINDGTSSRLVLSSRESGADAGIASMTFANGSLAEDSTTLQAGRDASLDINGIKGITSPTNRVEGAIQGVTLELDPSSAGETLSLGVEADTQSLKESVQAFVSTYNEMKSTVGRMTNATGDAETAGELVGDRTVRTIESRLSRDLTNPISGGELELMSSVGISLNESGRLELDEDKLDEVIADNPQGLQDFFAGAAEESGFAGRLAGTLDNMLDSEGMIERAIDSSEGQADRIQERYDRTEQRIERTVERYRSQFSQLDGLIAQMNSTSAYLSQQLAGLNTQNG